MGKGSSGTKTTYTQSPEQRQMERLIMPLIQGLSTQGQGYFGQPNMGAPSAPSMPSMSGVLSGVPNYQIPSYNLNNYNVSGYDVPSTSQLMPSSDWYNSMSPEVMAGVWAPYQQASKGMLEQLGGIGQLGSARGGASGAAGAALGQFGADAANKVGLQAWQMSQPGLQAGWQAQLGQNQYLAGQQNQQSQYMAGLENQQNQWAAQQQLAQNQQGYQQGLTESQTNYANQVAQQQADYAMQQQVWGMPFGMTGLVPGTYSQGITTQPQSTNWLGMLGGAAGGGMMGSQMSGGYGQGANTGLGAVFGALGGK